MPVMHVGIVWMAVCEREMSMPVRVRLADGIIRRVCMLMVRVVRMAVFVFERLVGMGVLVILNKM